jgi:hypothetical protein
MAWTKEDHAAHRVWIETWLREYPLPRSINKQQRWRIAHGAWCEMRRQTKAAERAAARATAVREQPSREGDQLEMENPDNPDTRV